ncbi:MAG TPA: glutamate--tRNA ligase, partial [Oxalicibacterium sp.]|nr:glutamate--tRNA ligase [Oxalicibacterium sp.]
LDHLTKSPAQFNPEKLDWLNNHYIKQADNARLAELARPMMERLGAQFDGAPDLQAVIALMKDRINTVNELAVAAMLFYRDPLPDAALLTQHVTDAIKPALAQYASQLKTVAWNKDALSAVLKEVLAAHKLKMPQLAMPLRLLITGQLQTPSIDAVIALFDREVVLARLAKHL